MPIKEVKKCIEHILDENKNMLAIVVRRDFNEEGVTFFTPENTPFQMGFIKYSKGYVSKPHTHTLLPKDNIVRNVQEVVFVIEGVFEVDFYGNTSNVIETVQLREGDSALFVSGGHGYKVKENCKVVTVKQGPYPGEETAKNYL